MSITDELRTVAAKTECANGRCEKLYRGDLEHIADRIDAEHQKAVAAAHSNGITEYGSMVAREYVKLPVDADGKVVRIGDVMVMASHPFGCEDKPLVVDRMELSRGMHGEVWCLALDTDRGCWTQAVVLRHYQLPTVEDVLREFTDAILEWAGKSGSVAEVGTWSEVAAEYAAKLRLAGDAE